MNFSVAMYASRAELVAGTSHDCSVVAGFPLVSGELLGTLVRRRPCLNSDPFNQAKLIQIRSLPHTLALS